MMASSSMDETMSETEPAVEGPPVHAEEVPEALPAAEFDATPWPVPTRPAPRPVRISRPLGPRLWTAALAGALLFTAGGEQDRKSTRLNSSHGSISYAVFCLKKKTTEYSIARVY